MKNELKKERKDISKSLSIFFVELFFGIGVATAVTWLNLRVHVDANLVQILILFFGFTSVTMGFAHGFYKIKTRRKLNGILNIIICLSSFVILEGLYIGMSNQNDEKLKNIIVIAFGICLSLIIISSMILMRISEKNDSRDNDKK